MTDTQAVEGQPATPPQAEETKPAEGSQEATPTAEQVAAEYKARLSGKDKAHAAEVATLQQQIDALKGESSSAASQAQAASTDVETLQKQLAAAQEANKAQAQEYTVSVRQAKYPLAAEALDAQSLAAMDEAKLAGLNARLAPDATPPPVASTTPSKTPTASKPTSEKTKDELLADLAKSGEQFAADISRGRF